MYSADQLSHDASALIACERAGGYSNSNLDKLHEMAEHIQRSLKASSFGALVPYEIWQLLGDIDIGAIEREWRTWIMDDAEAALKNRAWLRL